MRQRRVTEVNVLQLFNFDNIRTIIPGVRGMRQGLWKERAGVGWQRAKKRLGG